jgi:hypothetical protein
VTVEVVSVVGWEWDFEGLSMVDGSHTGTVGVACPYAQRDSVTEPGPNRSPF